MRAASTLAEFVPEAEQLRSAHQLARFFLHGWGLLELEDLAGLSVGQIEALCALSSFPDVQKSRVPSPDLSGNLVTLGVGGVRLWAVRPDGEVVFGLGTPRKS